MFSVSYSALDAESERMVQEALDRVVKGKVIEIQASTTYAGLAVKLSVLQEGQY